MKLMISAQGSPTQSLISGRRVATIGKPTGSKKTIPMESSLTGDTIMKDLFFILTTTFTNYLALTSLR